jgi:hypothetical protein
MAQARDRNTAKAPRWYADKKFSHLLQAMEDHLAEGDQPQNTKIETAPITVEVDAAIELGNIGKASQIVT